MYASRAPEELIGRYAGPYERWVYSEELGRPYAFPAIRLPNAQHVVAILEGPVGPCGIDGPDIRLPPLWPSAAADHAVTPIAFRDRSVGSGATTVEPDRVIARCLSQFAGTGGAPRIRVNLPVSEATWVRDYSAEAAPMDWRKPVKKPRAILGVIDDGLPFAHTALLGTDGLTRISHLWLQSASAKPQDRVPLGRELTNGEIDALRASHGADERRLYRSMGALDAALPEIGWLLNLHASHGGHILGLAGGNDPSHGLSALGDDIQIVAVQLPNTVAWDTSGFGKEMFMLSALHYIFNRASEIARACDCEGELPLVVNFSYGWTAGRHDGKSEMEIAIEQLLQRRRAQQPATAVVVPTGNSFESRLHARISNTHFKGGEAQIGWRLQPDDRTSSYLEIWLPEDLDPTEWVVRVEPPPGITSITGNSISFHPDPELDPVGDPRRFVEMEIDGLNVGQLSVDFHRGSRWRFMLAMIPTAETGTGRRLPSGLWRIEIDHRDGAKLGPDQVIAVWVQRDDDPGVMRMGGRQSTLEGAPGLVLTDGTLSAIATTPSVTRVAGFIADARSPARYSSAGGVEVSGSGERAWGVQPSFAAASDQGRMRPGLPSIGSVSGSRARLIGTSAAAALASRFMVANAAAGRALTAGLEPLPKPQPKETKLRLSARLGAGLVPVDP